LENIDVPTDVCIDGYSVSIEPDFCPSQS